MVPVLVPSRPARVSGVLAAAVGHSPGISHAPGAGAGRRRHHALLVRDEATVPGAIAAAAVVLRTPRPVDFARRRTNIERGERGQDQQEQCGAEYVHGEPPGSGTPSIHPYFRTIWVRAQ